MLPEGTVLYSYIRVPGVAEPVRVEVNPDGTFSLSLEGYDLAPGKTCVITMVAENDGQSRIGLPAVVTVTDADGVPGEGDGETPTDPIDPENPGDGNGETPTDPIDPETPGENDGDNEWDNIEPDTPSVDPIGNGDTSVGGETTPLSELPDGSTIEVVVVLPDGTVVRGPVNADESFEIPLGKAVSAGDVIRVSTVLTNNGEERVSDTVLMEVDGGQVGIITGGDGMQNPINDPGNNNQSGGWTGFLPQTSSANTMTLTAIGLGLMTLAAGLFFKGKRKKKA